MTVLEVLKQARALIALPENWTTRTCARDARGQIISPYSSDATQFCSVGAVQKAMGERVNFPPDYWAVCEKLAKGWGAEVKGDEAHNVSWQRNDRSTHEEVLHAFDVAILSAELDEGLPAPTETPKESLVAV